MFEGLVERLLNQILGQYVQDFSSENLHIGIWSGEVKLQNIRLKKEIMRKLNLPFMLKFSRIGCLKMNIPWKTLTSSKIEVLLEGLQLVVGEVHPSQWDCKNTKIIQARKEEIKSYCEQVLADFIKKGEKSKQSQQGYFSKLVVKIIDNLQITVKDIHIRFESNINRQFSFGVTLQQLTIYTVNSEDKPEYIDRTKQKYENQPLRKRLQLYNIGIYWNEQQTAYTEADYFSKLNTSIARRGQKKYQHNYIILLTSQAKLLQIESGKQFVEPEIDLQITLQTLKIEITNNQLQQIINLGERLQKYKRQVKAKNTRPLQPHEKSQCYKQFFEVFPHYCDGWGKNLTKQQLNKMQNVLQKLQVNNFINGIKQHLQKKQKQRIIKEKQQKNKSWFGFWSKPQELTNQQMNQIQNYLNDNFAKEVVVVKRPEDYYHINVNFKLNKLEVVIANTLAIIKEGIISEFSQLNLDFRLRQGGYLLDIALKDIAVKLFKQIGVESMQLTNVLYKIIPFQGEHENYYAKLRVVGNPLDKRHLNTDITVVTSELMLVFYPKIITIATQFADFSLSEENKEAAIEKYGQIKEKTTNAVNQSLEQPKKQLIGADIFLSSVTIVVPFDPKRPNKECWGLSLGGTKFVTDKQTLKRTELKQDLPLDVYKMNLKAFSFRQYESLTQIQDYRKKKIKQIDPKYAVIDNLDFDLDVQIYNRSTDKIPKIKINAELPDLSVNLNSLLYKNLLKMGDCFAQQQKHEVERATARQIEKPKIKDKATKIGMVYIKDAVTQMWKKYVAIMSDNYIYIYLNTKDENYYAYYYIKNATLQRSYEPKDKEKPYHFKIKNKLNQVVFGFDKAQNIDDWANKINNLSKMQKSLQHHYKDKQQEKRVKAPKDPNSLTLVVFAVIKKAAIQVHTAQSAQKDVIYFQLCGLQTLINLYQSKKQISLNLHSISLQDTVFFYKNNQLKYFLKCQRTKQSESLIKIKVNQLSKTHPQFDHVDSNIDIAFGNLICNYKCETVKALMKFFIPQNDKVKDHLEEISKQSEKSPTQCLIQRPKEEEESFSLKLKFKIRSVVLILVNQKIKTQVGKIGITELDLYTGISQKRLCLLGSLKQLYLVDYSRYPNTILQELEDYQPYARSLLKANIEQQKNMLQFNIQTLKVANDDGKKLLIDILLNNLTIYYTQQPILRLITYLNTQMLPSFETGPKEAKVKKQNDERPDPSQMDLKVKLNNVSIFIEPNPLDLTKKEYLQLNIQKILVNNNVFFRDYVKQRQKVILVQNYTVQLIKMCIYTCFYDQADNLHEYQLTNKLDFKCSTDLIANPFYYEKKYKAQFLNGLRVQCSMTPFFMGISQNDYNFIMKCLNWSITHDDGTQNQLYDIQGKTIQQVQKVEQKAPFYLKLNIQCLSLFIMHKGVPVAFMLLEELMLNFEQNQIQMNIDLTIDNLYGTAIEFKVEKTMFDQRRVLSERGMFNALGYQKSHQIGQSLKKNTNQLIRLFDRRHQINKKNKDSKPFMKFIMSSRKQQSFIAIQIDELIIDIDLKLLMILSTVANTDQAYIKGPKPLKEKAVDIMQELFPKIAQDVQQRTRLLMQQKQSSFTIIIKKLVGSVSDQHKEKFIVLEGQISFSLTNEGERSVQQLAYFFDNTQSEKLNHSQMLIQLKNLTLYFCKIKSGEIKSKREIMKPVEIRSQIKKSYGKNLGKFILSTEIQATFSQLIFFSSFVDFINIDIIIKDNLKDLQDDKSQKEAETQKMIEQVSKKANSVVQNRLTLTGSFKPIQYQLVNDCNSNFMPVLRLLIQDLKPFMDQYLIKTQITAVPLISLHFFNPRSSKWQPIIEPFQVSIVNLTLLSKDGQSTKIIIESKPRVQVNQIPAGQRESQQDKREEADIQTDILRINISTQMLSTLLAAKEIAMKYKRKLQNVNFAIVDFIMSKKKAEQQQQLQVQVSPFVFQNITNETIFLQRLQKEFQLDSFFKGPIKLDNDREIKFRLKGQTYVFGLDHFGTLRIGFSTYLIQYDVEKLNRLIRFIPTIMIQNKLRQAIYIKRQGHASNVPKKIEIGDKVPLDNIQSFAVSLNGSSYTEVVAVKDIYMLSILTATNKKFNILWNRNLCYNKYEIFQMVSPFIVNNCIPKSLSLQFIAKAKTINTKTIPGQHTHQVCASQNIAQIEFKISYPGYNWTKKFKYDPQKNAEQRSVVLQDELNGVTHLNFVFQKIFNQNQYILTIYCKKIIVNELQDKLIIYGNLAEDEIQRKTDNYMLLGGQRKNDKIIDDKVTLIGSQVGNKLRICGVNSIFDFATPVAIGGLGQSQSRIVVDRIFQGKLESMFTIIGVTISLMKMSQNCDIYCKKVVLTSKSIICNNTSKNIVIKQEFANKFCTSILKGEKQISIFGLPELKDKMHNGYTLQVEGFERSNVFNLPEEGSLIIKLLSKDINKDKGQQSILYCLLRAKSVDFYRFYEISEVSEEDLPYEVITKSKYLKVNIVREKRSVKLGQSLKFLNQSQSKNQFEVQLQINHQFSKDTVKVVAKPDDLNFKIYESIRIQRQTISGEVALQIYISFNEKTKTIVVDEIHNIAKNEQTQKQYLSVNLPEIIISINQNSQIVAKPYESLVVTLQRLIFILQETDKKTTYQFKLGFLQIDQAYPYALPNPVIITPHKFQEFTRAEHPEWVFNSMLVANNTYKQITFVDEISVDFNDIVVKFSLDFLNLVTQVSKEFTQILNYKDQSHYLLNQVQRWKDIQVPKQASKTFIRSINITPFFIDLSAELNLKKLGLQNNQLLNTIMSAVGVVVSSIEDAPIRLSGMKITNCIDTSEGITSKIMNRYKGDVVNQLYKIFGSLNIIGNPMGLLRNISTGFQDFSKKPAQGFVKGPAQLGKGIAQGTGSLVAHSVGGAFDSLSKITGTVSTGLASFAFDKNFEQNRQKQKMRRPQNVFQGLSKGGKAVLNGFKSGITGIFTQPYRSARKEGAIGFVKGAAKGLAGLVVKPVTGLIDFASKTTQGIKNNALMFEDKPNFERMRYPRVFYTECFIMKEYSIIDSQIQYILMKQADQQKFINATFVDCFAAAGGRQYLVVMREYVAYLDVVKQKVLKSIPISEFQIQAAWERKEIIFKAKKKSSIFHSDSFDVKIENEEQRKKIVELIVNIAKEKHENS